MLESGCLYVCYVGKWLFVCVLMLQSCVAPFFQPQVIYCLVKTLGWELNYLQILVSSVVYCTCICM